MASHAADRSSGFHVDLGDLATWLLAVFALGALIAAGLAYRKQSASDSHLAEQVRLQGKALKDQQAANAKQAEVLEAQRAELSQRAEAIARQPADAVLIEPGFCYTKVPGVRVEHGSPLHNATVTNNWYRPIRNVACRVQTQQDGPLHCASAVAVCEPPRGFTAAASHSDGPRLGALVEGGTVRMIKGGEEGEFVFAFESKDHQAILALRFTDDAGLHWQIDNDLHLEQLDSRDW